MASALTAGFVSCGDDSDDEKQNETTQQNDDTTKQKEAPTESFANALSSLKTVGDFSGVYSVEFDGDYKLDSLVKADITTEEALVTYLTTNVPEWKTAKESGSHVTINVEGAGCGSIVAENTGSAGGMIFGRNFDYKNGSVLLLHTVPYIGYESVSTSYPYFLTQERNWAPGDSVESKAVALSAIYVPMDGMNEKGLYISILEAGDDEATAQTAEGKSKVQTTVAARYILDNADTVDKALELLGNINMYSVHNTAYHFAIADNSGKSVVVEWINNEMKVTESKVVTNHYIAENSGKTAPSDDKDTVLRFNALKNAGEAANWKMNAEQVREALKAANAGQYDDETDESEKHLSLWSAVFEPSAKRVTYYFRENYDKPVVVQF